MDVNSLAHTKWECKYHIVFAPKYRRQIIYKQIRADVGEILGSLCRRKGIEIGRKILNDKNGSFTVSLIHRCYNFSGKNSRKYREVCKFEQTYGYRVTRRDIEDFVRTYPNGTFQTGITFEDFLKTRIGRAPQNTAESDSEYWAPDELDLSDYSSKKRSSNDEEDALGAGLLVIVSIIVLIILFRTGGLFKHWIISLICVIMLVGVFCDK